MSTAREVVVEALRNSVLRQVGYEYLIEGDADEVAGVVLHALAAAGFVVIQPTDPEVIERACRRLAHQTIAAGYGESWREFSTSVTRVLAALGEPADMPSIAQAMANNPAEDWEGDS